MVSNKNAKAVALIISATIFLASFIYIPDWNIVGLHRGSPFLARLGYSLFHVSPIHALLNAWCLLSIVFTHNISSWRFLTAYIVAIAVPEGLLSEIPTVGLSCVCFALLGSITFEVRRKIYFQFCMATYIAVGFLFPSVNAMLHLYSYLAGLFVGLLNAPLICKKK